MPEATLLKNKNHSNHETEANFGHCFHQRPDHHSHHLGFFFREDNRFGGQLAGNIPSNYRYTGLSEGSQPPGAVDFTVSAQSAIPAVVHKTKTNAKQVTNNLPRVRRETILSVIFLMTTYSTSFWWRRDQCDPGTTCFRFRCDHQRRRIYRDQ